MPVGIAAPRLRRRSCGRSQREEQQMPEAARKQAAYEDLYGIPENMTGQIVDGELIDVRCRKPDAGGGVSIRRPVRQSARATKPA